MIWVANVLTAVLIVLKLLGLISISWWLVFSPAALVLVLVLALLLFAAIVAAWAGR